MKRITLIAIGAVLLSGCAGAPNLSRLAAHGFDSRAARVDALGIGNPHPVAPVTGHANGDADGDGNITIAEAAAAKHMTPEQYEEYVRRDVAAQYQKHRHEFSCDRTVNAAQDLVCAGAAVGVDVSVWSGY